MTFLNRYDTILSSVAQQPVQTIVSKQKFVQQSTLFNYGQCTGAELCKSVLRDIREDGIAKKERDVRRADWLKRNVDRFAHKHPRIIVFPSKDLHLTLNGKAEITVDQECESRHFTQFSLIFNTYQLDVMSSFN